MSVLTIRIFRVFCGVGALVGPLSALAIAEPVDRVNPEIGTLSHGLAPTEPATQLPNAMFRFVVPTRGVETHRIDGLRLFQPQHRSGGILRAYPFCGLRENALSGWSGTWDQQHPRPESYSVYFDREQVAFSLVPARHAALAALGFEATGTHAFVLAPVSPEGRLTATDRFVEGFDFYRSLKVFFRFEFDRTFSSVSTDEKGRLALFFGEEAETVKFRYAVSYISPEQAAGSLAREIAGWEAEPLRRAARSAWNGKLSKIEVEGGSDDERTVFYTALWRCYERMVDISEYGRYRGWDGNVRSDEGRGAYTGDWVWDSFRAAHPLMTLLEPKAEALRRRAKNFTNLWDVVSGMFLPRRSDGAFKAMAELPGPRYSDYCEQSPRTGVWAVPFDTDLLAELMGGQEEATRRLDDFFDNLFWVPERGNKSIHGNEPSHHCAYLYNRFGHPEKTQRRVREILTRSYSTNRRGFDGNEDCGQMSAWYILSALGIYPLDPASGEYAALKIAVRNYAPDRWRVKRVTFNGRELTEWRVRHGELVRGGELTFEMDQ